MQGCVVGIDPGISGGLVVISLEGVVLQAVVMPTIKVAKGNEIDVQALRTLLNDISTFAVIRLVALERVHSMPAQGIASAFTFGRNLGEVIGGLKWANLPFEMVTPQAWQKAVLAGTQKPKTADLEKKKSKQPSIAFVRRRFPDLCLKATPRCTKDHDGIADAACIAEWARRQVVGNSN